MCIPFSPHNFFDEENQSNDDVSHNKGPGSTQLITELFEKQSCEQMVHQEYPPLGMNPMTCHQVGGQVQKNLLNTVLL